MADISKIKASDGITYDLKDATARSNIAYNQTAIELSRGNNVEAIPMQAGYIALDVAQTAMPPVVKQSSVYRYALVPCSSGDTFSISASGKSTAKPFGFLASDGIVLETANATSSTVDCVLINKHKSAPDGSAYLVINDNSGKYTSYKGYDTKFSLYSDDSVETIPAGADLNTYTTSGNYRVVSERDAGTILNLPQFDSLWPGRLTVLCLNTKNNLMQIYQTTGGGFRSAIRHGWYRNNAWSWNGWEYQTNAGRSYQLSILYSAVIPSGSDLNNYNSIGQYVIESVADAQNIANTPSFNGNKYAGLITVEQIVKIGNNMLVKQTYSPTIAGAKAERRFYNGAWSSWYLIQYTELTS